MSSDKVEFFMYAAPGRVIVQEDGFKYTGVIHIPDAAKRRPTTGKIVAVGDGVNWDILTINTKIVYGLYSGTVLSFKGQPAFRVLGQDEILAVLEGEPELEGSGT